MAIVTCKNTCYCSNIYKYFIHFLRSSISSLLFFFLLPPPLSALFSLSDIWLPWGWWWRGFGCRLVVGLGLRGLGFEVIRVGHVLELRLEKSGNCGLIIWRWRRWRAIGDPRVFIVGNPWNDIVCILVAVQANSSSSSWESGKRHWYDGDNEGLTEIWRHW